MKTDIFIDNNIAKNFSNPMDGEYKKLIRWLMVGNAYLVVSNKLLAEYGRTASYTTSGANIFIIIDTLTRSGRLIKITNAEIKEFQRQHFTKKVTKNLRSNREDHEHIPVVLLSQRKYALSLDDDFIYDLVHFPGFSVKAVKRPENLPYDE
jgi:hypothetical protein